MKCPVCEQTITDEMVKNDVCGTCGCIISEITAPQADLTQLRYMWNNQREELKKSVAAPDAAKIAETKKREAEIASINAVYEYKTEIVDDTAEGSIDILRLNTLLAEYSASGWRLKNVITNEAGKTRNGLSGSTTMDQTILIFERKVRKAKN